MKKKRLRECLDELGLSQVGFARLIGVDGSTVRRWLSGVQDVPRVVEVLLETMVARKISVAMVLRSLNDETDPTTFMAAA